MLLFCIAPIVVAFLALKSTAEGNRKLFNLRARKSNNYKESILGAPILVLLLISLLILFTLVHDFIFVLLPIQVSLLKAIGKCIIVNIIQTLKKSSRNV